ncbi:MAG TPA: type IV pilus secretin PilQ [Humidesulfovibrio sp.]|nr:type IV pilus secretin PilQ [Humidesulfovibrio sp.]
MVALLAILALGCSSHKQPEHAPVEDMAETWKAMEKQSQGHSPRGHFSVVEPPMVIDKPENTQEQHEAQAARLPSSRISLRMHNADIMAVLQALSRAAGKSLVLSPGVTGTVNLNIVERPWDEVFNGILLSNNLTYNFDGETIRVMSLTDLKATIELESAKKSASILRRMRYKEEPLMTSVAKVRFADAKLIKPTLEKTLTKDKDGKALGSVEVDELTNSLIIQSVDTDMPKLTRLLTKLDAPRAQIKLKAHIVETTKETARDLGILWGGSYTGSVRSGNKLGFNGGSSLTSTTTSGGTTSTTSEAVVGTGTLGALGVKLPASSVVSSGTGMALDMTFGKIGGNILETQLQALASENKLNIISSPSISTMDNQKAYTEAGERVPYQSTTGTGTDTTYTVNFQDAVLRLEITPHIIDEEFIKLTILVQKDEVDSSRTVAGNPYIVKKKTETVLIARNGETVVISGLSKLRKQLNESGIPGVMDIPGLGWLAKSQSKDDLKDEFMIFITPTVLADWKAGERQKTYEELEQELKDARKAAAEREARGDRPEKPATQAPVPPSVKMQERSSAPLTGPATHAWALPLALPAAAGRDSADQEGGRA